MSALSPESWKALSPLLDRALDMDEGQRSEWLRSVEEEDPETGAQLRSLLEEHRVLSDERFLEHRVEGVPGGRSEQGTRIGPYKLVRAIGEGGMGRVWLAERVEGEFEQKVAIKLLRDGGERASLRNRFLKERQFLANLNHPSIARLLDAGQAEDGRPYLIMEYVDGVPIDVYAASLEIRELVALFVRVCDGVAHAHRRLIIHRDLKPSNILVDRSGQPKLLDFGIAKLLDESGDATLTVERALTPNYASPEQFRGEAQTTATDVYSLGAVLYKMLTGRAPHEGERAGLRGKVAPATQWKPELPQDVAAIISKALREEPEERYASVEALADDLRAFLEWRPVRARAGDAWYLTRKLVRRHWIPIAAATVMIAGLAGGMVVANRERSVAQRRFAQVRQLANRVLELDAELIQTSSIVKARQAIVAMSQQYLEALRPEARSDEQLAVEIAVAYARLARVQGVPIAQNLGQYANAEQSLRRAEEVLAAIPATSSRYRKAVSVSIRIAHDRMILADTQKQEAEALEQARKAVAHIEAFAAMGAVPRAESEAILEVYNNVALAYKNARHYEEAIRYAMRATKPMAGEPSELFTLGNAMSIVADARRAMGDSAGALEAIQRSREAIGKMAQDDGMAWSFRFNMLWREGLVLGAHTGPSLGQTEKAIAAFQQAFDELETEARRDPNETGSRIRFASAARELGALLRDRAPGRALAIYDHAIRRLAEVPRNVKARRGEAELLAGSSYALRKLKRSEEAKVRIDKALGVLGETKDYPSSRMTLDGEASKAVRALADYHAETGDRLRAIALYEELIAKVMLTKPDPLRDLREAASVASLYESLGGLFQQAGRGEEAAKLQAQGVAIWEHWDRRLPGNQYVMQQLASGRSSK